MHFFMLLLLVCSTGASAWLPTSGRVIMKKVAFIGAVFPIWIASGQAAHADSAPEMFKSSCVGCHAGGGNILPFQGGKNLYKDTLKKNGYASPEAMAELILKGKAQMPAYGEFMGSKGNVVPARYSDEQAREISLYVLDQAQSGWPAQ